MKQYVYDFYGENELEEVIDRFRQERREKAGLFITLYHESNDLEKVKESIQTLRKAFPQSAIAGMSASGGGAGCQKSLSPSEKGFFIIFRIYASPFSRYPVVTTSSRLMTLLFE